MIRAQRACCTHNSDKRITKGAWAMKKILTVVVACLVLSSASFAGQTHRKTAAKRSTKSSTAAAAAAAQKQAAQKQAAEVQAARGLLSAQIKAQTQFLYLLGGI